MITIYKVLHRFALPLLLPMMIVSCRKFVDPGIPLTQTPTEVVFSDNTTATDAIVSVYGDMMSTSTFASLKTTLYCGQSADELTTTAPLGSNYYYTNSLIATGGDDFWSSAYKYIYSANTALEGLAASNSLDTALKNQLTGESLFIRAFCHFYLVNLFGDIPYLSTSSYAVNNNATRIPAAQVYTKIIADLRQAQSLLNNNFPTVTNAPGVDRIRPNKGAATAMLARVYLYTQDWADAIIQADSVIANPNYSLLTDMTKVFLKNSNEAIWQLQPSALQTVTNTYDGNAFIVTAVPSLGSSLQGSPTTTLLAAFESGDNRRTKWFGTYTSGTSSWTYPYKYHVATVGKVVGGRVLVTPPATTEYYMVLRLAEQYLVRAEARAQSGDLTGAAADLNKIRQRAGLSPTSAVTQPDLLAAVLHERQTELFCEWGHRWFDLKRTGLADAVLGPIKGSNWQTTDQLYPIPQTQLNLDPNMKNAQNPGY